MRSLWLLLVLAGCAGAPAGTDPPAGPGPRPSPPLSEEHQAMVDSVERWFRVPGTVTARLGEEVAVGDVRVRPLAVLEDSRCPIDVECVWAGRIRVRVAVSGVGETEMELHRPLAVPGREPLRLTAVAPPRWHRPPPGIDPNAAARFAFRRGGAD